jgi:D-beta-D-heptose 7-phosphate kinase/D-beta-D-heptose 1-phosphate adenosyltransferase
MVMTEIMKSFRHKSILVIGDLILDRYIFGRVDRISQEAPVPIVEVTSESFRLGGAANVANNIVSLGGKASVAGLVGKDRAAEVLREILSDRGIAAEGIIEDKRPTTVKARVIAHNQQMVRFDKEDARKLEGRSLERLLAYVRGALPHHDGVIVSDYRKGVVSPALMTGLTKLARSRGTFIAVDPKIGHFHLYKGVSVVTPNIAEASHGSGVEIRDLQSLTRAGTALMAKLGCGSVLITRGEQGMTLFEQRPRSRTITLSHIPTVAKKVFDVTGAGDTVIAAFTMAHLAGASLREAAIFANHAAGIVVGEVGTAVATPELIMESLRAARPGNE